MRSERKRTRCTTLNFTNNISLVSKYQENGLTLKLHKATALSSKCCQFNNATFFVKTKSQYVDLQYFVIALVNMKSTVHPVNNRPDLGTIEEKQ